jgi:acyl carrier protein
MFCVERVGAWISHPTPAFVGEGSTRRAHWSCDFYKLRSNLTMEETKVRVKAFLARYIQNHDLQDDEDIFAMGFINSLFAMQLVLFVEKEFQLDVENEDLDIDNFRTINAIAALVERKQVKQPQRTN